MNVRILAVGEVLDNERAKKEELLFTSSGL
jgi:hypothetical protein